MWARGTSLKVCVQGRDLPARWESLVSRPGSAHGRVTDLVGLTPQLLPWKRCPIPSAPSILPEGPLVEGAVGAPRTPPGIGCPGPPSPSVSVPVSGKDRWGQDQVGPWVRGQGGTAAVPGGLWVGVEEGEREVAQAGVGVSTAVGASGDLRAAFPGTPWSTGPQCPRPDAVPHASPSDGNSRGPLSSEQGLLPGRQVA